MFDFDYIEDLLMENIKKLFFPEWINLDLKFSKSEIFTLLLLDKRNEITMTELTEYINSPMSTATGIVDRLVKNGYIIRDRSETDRRIVVLRLTEKGSQFVDNLKNQISGYINMAVKDLTEEEKKFMTGILLKIMHNLQNKLNSGISANENKDEIKKIDIE
jgi:MarR family transcriptional regulator, organic hydroperoxide resistance regulator